MAYQQIDQSNETFKFVSDAEGSTVKAFTVKAGDIVQIADYVHTYFTAGSVFAMAVEYSECPIAAYERAKKHNHSTHWLNQNGSCISTMKQPTTYYRVRSIGDHIAFEGRVFRIEKAANRNVNLVEVAQ